MQRFRRKMMKLLINLFQTYLRASMRQVRGNLMYSYIWHFLLVNSFVLWIFHYLIGCIWFISCVVNPILEMATKRRNLQFFFFLFCHGWSRGHDAYSVTAGVVGTTLGTTRIWRGKSEVNTGNILETTYLDLLTWFGGFWISFS